MFGSLFPSLAKMSKSSKSAGSQPKQKRSSRKSRASGNKMFYECDGKEMARRAAVVFKAWQKHRFEDMEPDLSDLEKKASWEAFKAVCDATGLPNGCYNLAGCLIDAPFDVLHNIKSDPDNPANFDNIGKTLVELFDTMDRAGKTNLNWAEAEKAGASLGIPAEIIAVGFKVHAECENRFRQKHLDK